MPNNLILTDAGETINIQKAFAESYDSNAEVIKIMPYTDLLTQVISYNGSGFAEYLGFAPPGTAKDSAGWMIKKLVYSGTNVTDIQFADGDTKFDNIWDNRESLSYS